MLTRRTFLASSATVLAAQTGKPRPNILWLTCEDIGPAIGAYGDKYSVTPNIDRLASKGILYRNAWSNAPVCAPARTTIISGLYPPSTGSEHMRSMTNLPAAFKMFPEYLREAGYYCTNNAKEDYNLQKTGSIWDESSRKGHWRNRPAGKPFFAVFNHEITHESQIRTRPHKLSHDPKEARIPAYHPDTPEVRLDWAQYYDNITTMDGQIQQKLNDLAADGLADDTIVFFYGDHGSGMPRSKRWPYNSGLQVPLVIYIPDKFAHLRPKEYKPGGSSDRLVGFVDLAPTVLSLAGVKPPAHLQGTAYLGEFQTPAPEYAYGFRGRMDERYDCVRTARDHNFIYIRNFMPHKIYGQHIAYMFETPTTSVWKKMYDDGKLKPPQTYFWETKPSEELYDLRADRDEIKNLAKSPEHRATLEKMRKAVHNWQMQIRDVGLLPENEIHERSKGSSPYEVAHAANFPMQDLLATAELASDGKPEGVPGLLKTATHPDSAVRYWGILGLTMRGAAAVTAGQNWLRKALADPAPSVRIAAAEALGRYGAADDLAKALEVLVSLASPEKNGVFVSLEAVNALDALGPKAKSAKAQISALPRQDPKADPRMKEYVPRLMEDMLAGLG